MNKTEELKRTKKAETDVDIMTLLRLRWSPRTFKNEKIDELEVRQLFESARWAASSYNRQPWRFIYAHKNSEGHSKIISCLSDFNKKWAGKAPLLMLTAYKEKTEEGDENFHALHDLGLSLGNMTVQAEYLGIAMHHMAGVDWKKAEMVFNIPEGYHMSSAIALGYYGGDVDDLPEELQDQEKGKRERKKINEFAFEDAWPQ